MDGVATLGITFTVIHSAALSVRLVKFSRQLLAAAGSCHRMRIAPLLVDLSFHDVYLPELRSRILSMFVIVVKVHAQIMYFHELPSTCTCVSFVSVR